MTNVYFSIGQNTLPEGQVANIKSVTVVNYVFVLLKIH